MVRAKFPELSTCGLCEGPGPLRRSHIVPDFAIRRLRGSPTGTFRDIANPNRPLQGGVSVPLLCEACEQRFAQWEKAVQQLFFPVTNDAKLPIDYEPSLLLFAVSV